MYVSRLLQCSLGEIHWNSVKCEIRAWERLRHAALLHAEICWDSRPDEQRGKQQVVFSNFPHHIWDTVLTRMLLVEWLYPLSMHNLTHSSSQVSKKIPFNRSVVIESEMLAKCTCQPRGHTGLNRINIFIKSTVWSCKVVNTSGVIVSDIFLKVWCCFPAVSHSFYRFLSECPWFTTRPGAEPLLWDCLVQVA